MNRLITIAEADDLAPDLLRSLVDRIADPEAIETELQRWIDVLGVASMAIVLLAAVRLTFEECLTLTPLDAVPAARLALLPTLPDGSTAA